MMMDDSMVADRDFLGSLPGVTPSDEHAHSGLFRVSVRLVDAAETATVPLSRRDQARAIEGLKTLIRRSQGLSMQDTLSFACAFMSEAVDLSCVAVVHDRALRPLVWGGPRVDEAMLGRAASLAHRDCERMIHAPAGEARDPSPHEGDSRAEGVTWPLAIPLLGVVHFEGPGLLREGVSSFLRHAVILLSLALHRSFDCEPPAGELSAVSEIAALSSAPPHEVFNSALFLARRLLQSLDGPPGTCRYAADALRVARAMTLNVIDVLELHAAPPR